MPFALLTAVAAVLLLLADATPGFFSILFFCPCFGVAAAALLAGFWVAEARRALSDPRCRRPARVAVAITVAAAALFAADVPRRLLLSASRGELEALASTPPAAYWDGGKTVQVGRRVGWVFVDKFRADEEGGVWFRTASCPDGIGPDTLSYGFALRPSRAELGPFGHNAALRHLSGDWYSFSVSDD